MVWVCTSPGVLADGRIGSRGHAVDIQRLALAVSWDRSSCSSLHQAVAVDDDSSHAMEAGVEADALEGHVGVLARCSSSGVAEPSHSVLDADVARTLANRVRTNFRL